MCLELSLVSLELSLVCLKYSLVCLELAVRCKESGEEGIKLLDLLKQGTHLYCLPVNNIFIQLNICLVEAFDNLDKLVS